MTWQEVINVVPGVIVIIYMTNITCIKNNDIKLINKVIKVWSLPIAGLDFKHENV